MALDETIFLTGFPGFIAGRLVKRLATEGARFLLLVQPAFMQRAREEVARIASEMNANADSFHLIEGDITQHDLGLSPLELERVRRETTILFHLAAIYDLAVRRDPAMHVNVEGTRNVNRFALTLPNLRRYHYVSEAMTALMKDERATGKTFQLAAPNPLPTDELFEPIARAWAGHGSRITIPARLVRSTRYLPFTPLITGLPHAGVPYFFLNQDYDTTHAQELLEAHDVYCPSFPDYIGALVEYVERHPKL